LAHPPSNPLISVGLAVYNGEKYLCQAIESILAQTCADFELILSDNASTDATAEICRSCAARDSRIRYSRNATNIGGANNENLTFRLARGRYFRWAAHDDLMAPRCLEACVDVLESEPEVVLAYTGLVTIDGEGVEHDRVLPGKGLASRPSQRFFDLFTLSHDCETSYGLVRSEALRATDLQLNYTDSDRTLLAELALRGRFHQVPEYLFYKRYHPAMSTQQYSDWRGRMAWFTGAGARASGSPYWMQLAHYLRIIRRTPLGGVERARCYALMVWWVARHKRWLELLRDLPSALRPAAANAP
jgi:glycosyltransferase involved in cell wall biosynthesis